MSVFISILLWKAGFWFCSFWYSALSIDWVSDSEFEEAFRGDCVISIELFFGDDCVRSIVSKKFSNWRNFLIRMTSTELRTNMQFGGLEEGSYLVQASHWYSCWYWQCHSVLFHIFRRMLHQDLRTFCMFHIWPIQEAVEGPNIVHNNVLWMDFCGYTGCK